MRFDTELEEEIRRIVVDEMKQETLRKIQSQFDRNFAVPSIYIAPPAFDYGERETRRRRWGWFQKGP